MDKARVFLERFNAGEEADRVSCLSFPPRQPHQDSSFYDFFTLRGVRIARFQPGSISCSFKVPPRLTGRNGKMAMGAIASLIDLLGAAVVYLEGHSMNVSVDMSISYMSPGKLNDDLEIISRCLGQQGKYSGTHVLIRNKTTGEVVAEGRHSLFNLATSKM